MILRMIGQYPNKIVFAGYFIPVDDFTGRKGTILFHIKTPLQFIQQNFGMTNIALSNVGSIA